MYKQHKNQRASKRLAYLHQLQQADLSVGCVACIGGYLWLSSMIAVPQRHILFIDPLLAEEMVSAYSNLDPLELDAPTLAGSWDRELMWPEIAPDARILVMAMPEIGLDGADSWILVDLQIRRNEIAHVELLVGPPETTMLDACDEYLKKLVYAIKSVLPGPDILARSPLVDRQIKSIGLPLPYTDEAVGHVLLASLCSKLLCVDISQVNVPVFRESVLHFYEQRLRPNKIKLAVPWPGITNQRGQMYGHQLDQRLVRRPLSPSPGEQPSSHDIFLRTESHIFTLIRPGLSEGFFTELAQAKSSHKETILSEIGGRSVELWERGLLLAPCLSWPEKMGDQKLRTPEAFSLLELTELIISIGGPTSLEAQRLVLTGKYRGEDLTVDWLKDTVPVEKEGCLASSDVDSLSLTVEDAPRFSQAGSYYAYPSRAHCLTNNNSLTVKIGSETFPMHQSMSETIGDALN